MATQTTLPINATTIPHYEKMILACRTVEDFGLRKHIALAYGIWLAKQNICFNRNEFFKAIGLANE